MERKAAIAEEAKKKANKDKNPKKKPQAQASKERTHPFSDYKEWMCMHCKREDVAPKACKHPKEFCFRRPGGPLDAEGIKEPKARDKRSRELAAERRAQTLKTKASTKKVVRLATTTQSVGIPKRQVTRRPGHKMPEGGWTDEQKTRLSSINEHFHQYLHSKEWMDRPLTHEDVDRILPEDVCDSQFLGDIVTWHFGREGRQRSLNRFRTNPQKVIDNFRCT